VSAVVKLDRQQGLGASDAAASVGLSKWRTPVDLYLEKTGQVEPDYDAEALHLAMGKALEPVVLQHFCRKSGLKVRSQQKRVVDPAWPVRWVTLDAIASDMGMVEAKTVGVADTTQWGDPLTNDAVPMQYYLQCQHGMACTGLAHTWLPVLILNRQFRLYRVVRDEELIEQLTVKEKEFWQCVESLTPPDIVTLDDASALWPRDNGKSVLATPEIIEAVSLLKASKVALKLAATEIDALTLRVKMHMAEHTVLVDAADKPLATWKQAKGSLVFDEDAFAVSHPKLYKKFHTERPGSRRLLLK
jgi:putative phage-type endonuclease